MQHATISIKNLSTVLPTLFAAKTVPFFAGPPGIGKTEVVRQWAKEQNIGLVFFEATSIEPLDARGFLIPAKNSDGSATSVFTRSPLMEMVEATGHTKGIVFCDEFAQAAPDVQKALAPLFSERRLGDETLPEGWVVWAAGNRPKDRAGANKILSHVINRMSMVEVTPHIDAWATWAIKARLPHQAVAFAKRRPDLIMQSEPPADGSPYPTPRSYTNAVRTLQAHQTVTGSAGLPEPTGPIGAICAGFMGAAATAEFAGFLRVYLDLPTIEDIIDDPKAAPLPSESRLDAQFAASAMITYHAADPAHSKNVDALATYALRLRPELTVSTLTGIMSAAPAIVLQSRILADWVQQNPDMLTATLA